MLRMPISILLVTATLVLAIGARAESQQTPYDPKAAFAATDKNGDGEIDLAEFHDRLVEVFFSADTNKDGFLSPDEYKQLVFSGDFKEADINGDGRVSLHEFVSLRYQQFQEADTNHDGALSIEEVVTVYERQKKP